MECYVLLALFVLVVGYLAWPSRTKRMVNSLNTSGWVLYLDASNCGFCQKQLSLFGPHFATLNKVHCDDADNLETCKKYPDLPTWVNTRTGAQSVGAKLSIESLGSSLVQE